MEPTKTGIRERLLLNLLPAALVLALYAFLFALPAQKTWRANFDKLESVRRVAVDKSAAEVSRSNLDLAQSGLQRLNEQIRLDRDQIAFLGKPWSSGDARLSTVQEVTELLQQFRLSIVNQDFVEEPTLSIYLNELEDIVRKHSGENEKLEYWQIELAGSYPDMMKFLNEVKTSGLRAIPVTISMKASESSDGIHNWTVVFVV